MTPTVLVRRASGGPDRLDRRRVSRGQGVAEFALCAPIALIVLLGIIEAGFLMFGVGTAAYATGEAARVGSEAGNQVNADSQVIAVIVGTGLGQNGVVNVTEVDIYRLIEDPNTGNLTVDTNGCGGSGCMNKYDLTGNPLVTPEPWAATTRDVTNGSSDFMGVTIKYQYRWKSGALIATAPLSLSAKYYVRLEPQTY
jgi:Flp pilus assembly protein TadG